jgi:hypothetical protein
MTDDVKERFQALGIVLPAELRPDVARLMLEQAEVEERERHAHPEPMVDRRERDEETRRIARRVFEEDREFFELLGVR